MASSKKPPKGPGLQRSDPSNRTKKPNKKPKPKSNVWIVTGVERLPADIVAARTVRQRLDAVWKWLPSAGSEAGRDPEAVHQLRVATRRGLAALDAFRDRLPEKRTAWFEKRLRRIRRAAGEARDLDVLSERLAKDSMLRRADASPAHGTDGLGGKARRRLVAMLAKQRDVSHRPIRLQLEKMIEADWPARVDHLLDGLDAESSRTVFAAYAGRRFRPMIKRFFRLADRRLHDAEEMHSLRIEGKKLRYAMEIFASVFPDRVQSRCYESLERLQATLGDFTDHASAADRFRRWADEKSARPNRDALEWLRRFEEARADEARRHFTKWWNPSRRRTLLRRFERTIRRDSA
jgi:CHAD domain-containing protein